MGGELTQLRVRQAAMLVAHPVFRGADLHDHVAAAFKVIGRQPSLAGIHPAARPWRPRDRACTAGFEIAPKLMPLTLTIELAMKGFCAKSLANGQRRRRQAVFLQHRERRIDEHQRTGSCRL
jgi:hypothetical protein